MARATHDASPSVSGQDGGGRACAQLALGPAIRGPVPPPALPWPSATAQLTRPRALLARIDYILSHFLW